jgi:recombination protein RecA
MGAIDDLLGAVSSTPLVKKVEAAKPVQAKPEVLPPLKPLANMKERLEAVRQAGIQLDKQYSTANSVVRLGDKARSSVPSYCTELATLDYGIIQTGGIPRGRIIEIFGPESSGKTTIALHIIGAAQRRGELGGFVDAEHALDPSYAQSIGVNTDDLIVSQPDFGEQALETVIGLVDSGALSIIVVDSVAALVPKAEIDGEMGDSHMGLQARMMSQACRKLTARCARSGTSVIFINQIREKIGVMFGSPETTTGGRALKFFSSVRLDVRRRAQEMSGTGDSAVPVGHWIEIKAVKNKVAAPFRKGQIYLDYDGGGLDKEGDLLTYGETLGVVEKSGAWYSYKGERLGQGTMKAAKTLKDNPQLIASIVADIEKKRAA